MPIPTAALPTTASIEPYSGAGALGGTWGTATTVPARFRTKTRTLRSPQGNDVVASAELVVRPEHAATIQSRATVNGGTYTVVGVEPVDELRRGWATRLILEGPR